MLQVSGLVMGIISLIFGVIVMIFPKILNYLIGIYLIIVGLQPFMVNIHDEPDFVASAQSSEGSACLHSDCTCTRTTSTSKYK